MKLQINVQIDIDMKSVLGATEIKHLQFALETVVHEAVTDEFMYTFDVEEEAYVCEIDSEANIEL